MPDPQKISHYQIEEQLGEGGMGRVFRAVDIVLHRPVALKLLSLRVASDPGFVERFRREARLAAQLNHPNIATIYEFGEEGSDAYLAMELVEGETLGELLRKGPLPIAEVRRLGRQMASALAAAHARGIVHRDIKPANLMLTADGDLKVMDFGVSRRIGETQLTMAGSLVGTASIMAPEIVQGREAGPEADLFSMGCVLYEMLSGSPPFAGEDAMGTLFRIVNQEPLPLADFRGDIPPDLLGLVDGLLEKDPAKRYGPAAAVAKVLAEELTAIRPADATMVAENGATMVLDRSGIAAAPTTPPVPSAGGVPTPPPTATATIPPSAPAAPESAPRARLAARWVWLIVVPVAVGLGLLGWVILRPQRATTPAVETVSPERAEAMRLNDLGVPILNRMRSNPALVDSASIAQARAYFREASEKDPSLTSPWNNLGELLVLLGDDAQAENLFRSSIDRDPDYAPPHANLASIYERSGRLDAAIDEMKLAMQSDSTQVVYPNNLTYLLVMAGRPYEAIQIAGPALRRPAFRGTAPLWKNLGLAYVATGDPDDLRRAEDAFNEALRLLPNYPDALAGLARVAEKRGDVAAARERWTAVREHAQGNLLDEANAALRRLGS